MTDTYGPPGEFLRRYNPDAQLTCAKNTDSCLFGRHPRINDLAAYGGNMPMTWILVQLTDLSEYCGCRDKLQGKPLEQCASIIAERYGWLKVTEMMLFLYRLKAGDYGRFYGSIDPLIITTAIRSFIEDRNVLVAKHEEKLREQREREDRKKSITYEEWKKMQAQSQ